MTREEHLLTIAIEECAEVAQRLTKALRFGVDEAQPGQAYDNKARVEQEFIDLVAALEMAGFYPRFASPARDAAIQAKKDKVEHFLNYSAECGTLHGGL